MWNLLRSQQLNHDDGAVIKVIAGNYEGVEGAVTDIYADPTYLDVHVPANSFLEIPVNEDQIVLAYVFEGEGIFGNFETNKTQDGTGIEATKMLIFGEGNIIRVLYRR